MAQLELTQSFVSLMIVVKSTGQVEVAFSTWVSLIELDTSSVRLDGLLNVANSMVGVSEVI